MDLQTRGFASRLERDAQARASQAPNDSHAPHAALDRIAARNQLGYQDERGAEQSAAQWAAEDVADFRRLKPDSAERSVALTTMAENAFMHPNYRDELEARHPAESADVLAELPRVRDRNDRAIDEWTDRMAELEMSDSQPSGPSYEDLQYERDIEAWEDNGIAREEAKLERQARERATAFLQEPRASVLQKFPDLQSAYQLQDRSEAFAKQHQLDPSGGADFAKMTSDFISQKLIRGEKLPQITQIDQEQERNHNQRQGSDRTLESQRQSDAHLDR